MRSALIYLVLLVAGIAGILWLAQVGGAVEIRVGDAEVLVGLPVALLLLAVLFMVLHLLLVAISALRRLPGRLRDRKAARRRGEGDAAVTRALVALAAGTSDAARIEVKRARKGLGDTPQTLLLAAEAERLAGREEAATEIFRQLAATPDARFLGLRGLLRQAIQKEDWPAAQRLAREAEAAQPGAAWLRQERETLALRMRDWREALTLAPPGAGQAALALAAAGQEPDATRAAELERQGFAADPAFAPVALAHAQRLKDSGSPRRARAVLEQAWTAQPHPDLARDYLVDDVDALARMKSAEVLVKGSPRHAESRLLVGRAALEAGLTGRARQELDALVASGQADRRAFLALSDLEEAEHGETPEGRAAQARWLRQAATAAPEPRWRCASCGTDHAQWAPVCPKCQAVGTINWASPQTLPATVG
ncbi:heme biosynthesis HemY N-terminal domain-containing protein [Falsiroseomonas sp.]|uniref:heme biosynthesis HemY N-terminal domain-containing protein n=1 Tax=Falsiroseomonas sp. TaxID=2870721 RepID=UPI002735F121|nr:heme biosynthesis HemY N-terminal domain-containing protein [Falsiroseomonas sp.]MDP3414771.1 heme biosynthesis HemY N-terminal domain-containing protein [Falsiroseomonas sp.]